MPLTQRTIRFVFCPEVEEPPMLLRLSSLRRRKSRIARMSSVRPINPQITPTTGATHFLAPEPGTGVALGRGEVVEVVLTGYG
jgi:hypothetical protein